MKSERRAAILPTLKRLIRLIVCLILVSTWDVVAYPGSAAAQGPLPVPGGASLFFPPYVSTNDRIGFAQVLGGLSDYDVARLNAGWYVNWNTAASPSRPFGLAFVQTIRLHGSGRSCLRACTAYKPACDGIIDYGSCRSGFPADPASVSVKPSRDTIRSVAAANPGSLWMIGNEQDRILYQDDVCPDEYALVYHELYELIKAADPTARVAIGGVVPATPIRLQYLDIVRCAYQSTYGVSLPVDLWNVHAFVLNEQAGSWGAELPPGMVTASRAQRRNQWDSDDMDLFGQQIVDFRKWMNARGERNKPLIVSEYGVLQPTWLCDGDPSYSHPSCGAHNGRSYNFSCASVFMRNTFDYFRNTTDSGTGYPGDGNRLVQAWNWYSLDNDRNYGGNLFFSTSKQITILGSDFATYVTPLKVSYVDLLAWNLSTDYRADLFDGDPVTVTVSGQVFNMGNQGASNVLVRLWNGQPGVGTRMGGDRYVANVRLRYQDQGAVPTVVGTWSGVATSVQSFYLEVNPEHTIGESQYGNNVLCISISLGTARLHLPVVHKS